MVTTKRVNQYKDLLEYSSQPFRPIEFLPVLPMYTEEDQKRDRGNTNLDTEPPINPFEPSTLEEFIGQEHSKEVIKIIVDSANKEKRLIPNILLTGAYGHGKTTLAKLIAKRHRKSVQIIDGSSAAILVKPNKDKIYVIDEAHNIPPATADSFNILIDSGNLRIIACTTNPGALSAPFRSRFRAIYLEEYHPKDISKIVEKASKRLSLHLDKPAIHEIANRSKCNPRASLTILDFVREVAVMSDSTHVTSEVVQSSLTKLGIDEIGLSRLDRKYLETLSTTHPVGLQYISSILSVDTETIQEEIEPYLLRLGLVERTSRGRIKVSTEPRGDFQPIEMTDDLMEQLKESLEMLDK